MTNTWYNDATTNWRTNRPEPKGRPLTEAEQAYAVFIHDFLRKPTEEQTRLIRMLTALRDHEDE